MRVFFLLGLTRRASSFCRTRKPAGLLTSFGAFQEYYASDLLSTSTSFQISAIGSLQSFLMVFLGFATGPLFDMGHLRALLAAGTLLIVGGTAAQSAASTLWQLLLAQGACVGAGTGCLAILSVGVPSMWFDGSASSRLPLANGLAACGSGVGGVVYPVLFRRLNAAVGFGWAVRVIALVALLTLGFANATMRLPPAGLVVQNPSTSPGVAAAAAAAAGAPGIEEGGKEKKSRHHRALYDPTAVRDGPYCLFVVGCFTTFLGLYVPYFYLPSYATHLLLAESTTAQQVRLTGDDLLSILNGVSVVGRILLGYLAVSIGPQNLIVVVSVCSAIVVLSLMAVESSLGGLIATVCLYGFLTGAFFALQPSVFVGLSAKRPELIGTRFGMAFTVMSFGMLLGSPIAGELLRAFGYPAAWTWSGAAMLAGAILILGSLISREGHIYSCR